MKSRIKQITLLDGKQLFYPSDSELEKLNNSIESIITEHHMSVDEFNKVHHCLDCFNANSAAQHKII